MNQARKIAQAIEEHVGDVDQREIQDSLRNASGRAADSGDPRLSARLAGMLSQHGSNPSGLKREVVSLITDDPEVLQHFEPSFVRGILNKL